MPSAGFAMLSPMALMLCALFAVGARFLRRLLSSVRLGLLGLLPSRASRRSSAGLLFRWLSLCPMFRMAVSSILCPSSPSSLACAMPSACCVWPARMAISPMPSVRVPCVVCVSFSGSVVLRLFVCRLSPMASCRRRGVPSSGLPLRLCCLAFVAGLSFALWGLPAAGRLGGGGGGARAVAGAGNVLIVCLRCTAAGGVPSPSARLKSAKKSWVVCEPFVRPPFCLRIASVLPPFQRARAHENS